LFGYIHSIDRWEILELLDRYKKPINVLFELNLSKEATKHGTNMDNLRRMLENVGRLKYIKPVGLMTMAPFVDDQGVVRGVFGKLRETLHKINSEFSLNLDQLSMGMSSDFEIAIEEGATLVRVGTAIFGERI
ncbi:MAG: alanine racemase, partial [Syntrophorhabdaceae bacterium]|nr:alanine racemase [Syntrophorhabdaceae bacterium]